VPNWQSIPSISIPTASGNIGADVTLTNNTTTTIFSTASLAVGTWVVRFQVCTSGSGPHDSLLMAAGTATATFSGPSNLATDGGTAPETLIVEAIVTVTVAGTLNCNWNDTSGSSRTAYHTTPAAGSVPFVTGYTAFKVG
jgi:hypothetical protein